MSDPPTPVIPAYLLAVLMRLQWRFATTDPSGLALGTLYDGARAHHFVPTAGGWAVMDELAPGLGPFLLCAHTFAVLSRGTLNPDGSMSYEGRTFRVHQWFTGANWSARAVPCA
jgi:hypothetical protein